MFGIWNVNGDPALIRLAGARWNRRMTAFHSVTEEEAAEFGKKLDAAKLFLERKGGEGGKTFGAVTAKEIAAGIKDQLGYDIDKKKLVLSDSIKSAGEFSVGIKLHPKVTANMTVIVKLV